MNDLAPGTVVEMYRGSPSGPFTIGSQWLVLRAWDADLGPCDDCIPGFNAPCIELAGFEIPAPWPPLCSCSFRPVRDRTEEARFLRRICEIVGVGA